MIRHFNHTLLLNKSSNERFPKHNPSKIIFNFPNYDLSDSKESLLIKGLNFSLPPPKKLNDADYLAQYELFYRNIQNLKVLLKKAGLLTN